MEYRQQLRGWQGAVVGVAIVGVVAYQCARRIQTVDDSARFAIGVSLTREYQGRGLKEQVQEYLKQRASGEALNEPPPSDVPIPMVALVSVQGHGFQARMVPRVPLTADGCTPP